MTEQTVRKGNMALIKPSEEQVKELAAARIAQRVYKRKISTHDMLCGVFLCALANWELLEPTYLCQKRYAAIEDVDLVDFFWKKIEIRLKGDKR